MHGSIGEELVCGYYKYIHNCDFVQKNLKIPNGEMDVAAINLTEKIVYGAEVAIHLETGLAYTKNGRRVNTERLVEKFLKNIPYIQGRFPDFQHRFSLWSPIVKKSKRSNNILSSQFDDVHEAKRIIESETGISIELIINEVFLEKIDELKNTVVDISSAIEDNVVLRYLQLETKLRRFCNS